MSDAPMIELHNNSNGYAKVWIEGKDEPIAHVLPPHTTLPFEPEVANKFLAEYAGMVVEDTQEAIPDRPGQRRVWLANVTGNPFLPDTIFVPGKRETDPPEQIPNPLKQPITLEWLITRPEEVHVDESNLPMSHHYPPTLFKLKPFDRQSVPESVAMQLIQRDSCCIPMQKGKIIECREPQPFEPNRSWGLNDLMLYARLCDDHFFTEKRFSDMNVLSEEGLGHDKNKIREARGVLWQYIFHIIVDKRRGLPPKGAFDAAKARISKMVAAGNNQQRK